MKAYPDTTRIDPNPWSDPNPMEGSGVEPIPIGFERPGKGCERSVWVGMVGIQWLIGRSGSMQLLLGFVP